MFRGISFCLFRGTYISMFASTACVVGCLGAWLFGRKMSNSLLLTMFLDNFANAFLWRFLKHIYARAYKNFLVLIFWAVYFSSMFKKTSMYIHVFLRVQCMYLFTSVFGSMFGSMYVSVFSFEESSMTS